MASQKYVVGTASPPAATIAVDAPAVEMTHTADEPQTPVSPALLDDHALTAPLASAEAPQSEGSKYINGVSRHGHGHHHGGSGEVGIKVRPAESSPLQHRRSVSISESENKAAPKRRADPPALRRSSVMLQPPTLQDREITGDDTPEGMFRPGSRGLILWSYLIMAVSIYNAVTIPYRWTFWQDPIRIQLDVVFMLVLDVIGDSCFVVEMYLQLRTGFVDDGVIVWDRQKIWQRYFKSWFWLDLITVIPFDFIQIGMLRLIPAVRAPKILRFFQVLHHYNTIEENTTVSLAFRLVKLLFYTGVLSHFVACLKYIVMLKTPVGIGHHNRDELDHRSEFGKYLQAMYWSTGVMTGRDDSGPVENIHDAAYTIGMMIIGVLWLAYIIASLETFAHDGNRTITRFQAKLAYVQQFMLQFQLPQEMQDKVKQYYNYVWSSTLRFETDSFLATLPVTLKSDVQLQLHSVIQRALIFESVDSGFMALIVHKLSTIVSIPGEVICDAGMGGTEMFFIVEGEIDILIGPKLAKIATLRTGDSFGEYAILLPQPHHNTTTAFHEGPQRAGVRTSTARSVSYSTLLVLGAEDLLNALSLFPNSNDAVRAQVAEHRARTAGQERNFLGLDQAKHSHKKSGGTHANAKLQKLIQQEGTGVVAKVDEAWTCSPQSGFYLHWQSVYFIVMCWNAIMLPFEFGFLAEDVIPGLMAVNYCCDLFLILDTILSFRVRYVDAGAEVSDPQLIQKRYLRTWLIPNIVASIPLDFIMITSGIHPLYRLNRAIRLFHCHLTILSRMKDATHYELMSLGYLISNFLFLSHWSACVYYALTRREGFEADLATGHPNYDGWRPSSDVERGPLLYQYLVAQFYSMSMLAGIGRHVYPPTDLDALLSIFNILTGSFVVSYLIGKCGPLIIKLNEAAADFKAEVDFVTHLLEYRKVTPDVRARVVEYMRHIWTSQKGIDPNVALLGLPMQLKTSIMMHICEDMIRRVPRFKDLDDSFVRQLVTELTFVELPAGEFAFRQGDAGSQMYFISKGLVEILFDAPKVTASSQSDEAAKNNSKSEENQQHQLKVIGAGSFFGEGALFSGTRAASIRAREPVRLLSLSAASFQKVMHVHPHFAEKIMFLNAERQRRMEGIAGVTHEPEPEDSLVVSPQKPRRNGESHRGGGGANDTVHMLSPGHTGNRPSETRLSPRPRTANPGANGSASPRGRKNVRQSVLHVGVATGLESKVKQLMQTEKEKQELSRQNMHGSPSQAARASPLLAVPSVVPPPGSVGVGITATGGASASALAVGSSASGPASASVAASSLPVGGSSSTTAYSPGHPPTLTITTTHTIALHDDRHRTLSNTSSNAHVTSGVDVRQQQRNFGSPQRGGAAADGARDPPILEQERSVHAGVPPGFSMAEEDEEQPLGSPSGGAAGANAGDALSSPVLLNPARSSYPGVSSASSNTRRTVPQLNTAAVRPESAGSQTHSHRGTVVGGVGYPSSASVVFSVAAPSSHAHQHEPASVGFPQSHANMDVGGASIGGVGGAGAPADSHSRSNSRPNTAHHKKGGQR